MQILIGGGIYGVARNKIDEVIRPFTSKIPLGSIADEAALFGLAWFAHKNLRDKTARSIAMAGMAVEAAAMGQAISNGSAFSMSSNGANTNSGTTLM